MLAPYKYKGSVDVNLNEKMTMDGFPQCAYNIDSFRAWLAQNSVSSGLAIAGGAISTIAGAVTGSAVGVSSGILSIEGRIQKPFSHKVACYYGCLLVRPDKVLNYDRAEDPQTIDIVMKKTGADPVDYPYKTECCGAGFSISRTDIVSKLSGKIIEDAEHRGAEAIMVACPMCHSNLDMRRGDINKYWKKEFNIPVLFVTQAIGLAIGLPESKLGLKRHFVEVKLKSEIVKDNL
jgi:heterodisulfide reductase subunit B